jgi:4-hydroxy-tetrahydrodipicolinate synthase
MPEIEGVLTAMVTPFSDDGSVDEAAARKLARHLIENGCHGLVVAGTTGEASTLTDEEQISLLRAVVDEVGNDGLIVCGTGSNDTAHCQRLSAAAAEAGANAILVVTPYYNKPNWAGIVAHYEAVTGAAGIPLILYNIPSRVVINLSPEQLAELGAIDNIVGVKQANDDELGPIDGLDVLAGNDNIFLRCLEVGGTGGILTSANVISAEMRAVYDAAVGGELDKARELNGDLESFYEAMFVTANPIPVKAALEMLGFCSARARLPIVEADDEQRATVREALEAQGLLARA